MRTACLAFSILVAAAFMSCDDNASETLTLEDYIQEIDGLTLALRDKEEPILETIGSSDDVGRLKGALGLYPDAVEEYLEGVRGLDPPPVEATEAQQDALNAAEQFLETLNQAVEDTRNAATVDNFFALADSVSISVSSTSMVVACDGLQALADEHDINVDLACPTGIGADETPAASEGKPAAG